MTDFRTGQRPVPPPGDGVTVVSPDATRSLLAFEIADAVAYVTPHGAGDRRHPSPPQQTAVGRAVG